MQTRFLIAIVLLASALVAPNPSVAQDKPKCDPAAVIKMANALKSGGNSEADMTALIKLQTAISEANIACNGMKFSGNSAKLIGPFDLPAGIYRVTVTTTSHFFAELKVLSGKCDTGHGFDTILLVVVNIDGTKRSDEAILQSEGCNLVIKTSDILKPWQLTIEPLQQ